MFIHDMVHNNPGQEKYESSYNNPDFLKQRGYDGKVFDLFDCAQFALTFSKLDEGNPSREPVYRINSPEWNWVNEKYVQLKKLYQGMIDKGIKVYFMMDIIVLPIQLKERYPEILNENGRIDIKKPKMLEVLNSLFAEMFEKFSEISGIYIRYGETYVGEKYHTPYHCGNNPILTPEVDYHKFLMNYLLDTVCKQYGKEIFYRTWGFGDFQYDKERYLEVSNLVPTHPLFYFCIKHTQGDFHRNFRFNQCLNVGKHQQVVEIQSAREYEGKGAFPNYISNGVINGFEELSHLMKCNETHCLSDVMTSKTSLIKGMWIWSRGGGWDGPYINGRNGYDGTITVTGGKELWIDINCYVLSHWAKNKNHTEQEYVISYAKEILHMKEKDANIMYKILRLSEHGVLLGRGTNIVGLKWDVFWTRDQNIYVPSLKKNICQAYCEGCLKQLLEEKRQSVEIWAEIVALAKSIDEECEIKNYIITTCQYGYYLFSLFETMYRVNGLVLLGEDWKTIDEAIKEYDQLWAEWNQLAKSIGCPTLYAKEDTILDLIGYRGNTGFDGAINYFRDRTVN